jgi:sulfur-oxidizing protein SoxY
MTDRPDIPEFSRRGVLAGLGAGLLLTAVPIPVRADQPLVDAAIRELFGDTPRAEGKITMTLPPLAETGNNVPIKVVVDSPMDGPQRPKRAVIIATLNPRALVGEMIWGPGAAKAEFSTNMRLSGTQDVITIAELADGTLWQAQVRVMVTVGACDTLSIRY